MAAGRAVQMVPAPPRPAAWAAAARRRAGRGRVHTGRCRRMGTVRLMPRRPQCLASRLRTGQARPCSIRCGRGGSAVSGAADLSGLWVAFGLWRGCCNGTIADQLELTEHKCSTLSSCMLPYCLGVQAPVVLWWR